MGKVFLGGTCNGSTWREQIIPQLRIAHFNPVVEDWTPECQAEEERQKDELCDIHLYVITPRMKGVFSIAEVVESAMTRHEGCVFCYLKEDGGLSFDKGQCKSLDAVGRLVARHGAMWFETLEQVVNYLNA